MAKTLKIRKTVGDLKSLDIADKCLDSSFAERAVKDPKAFHDAPIAQPDTADSSLGWRDVGRLADVSSVVALPISTISLAILGLTLREYQKGPNAWNSLSKFEQTCGRPIASSFANAFDNIETTQILRVLTDNHGIAKSDAQHAIAKFFKTGLIKKIGKTGQCTPVITRFAKLVPLFQLFR